MTRLNSSSPRLKREVSTVPAALPSSSRPRLVLTAPKLMPLASSTISARNSSVSFSMGSMPCAVIVLTACRTCAGTPDRSTFRPQMPRSGITTLAFLLLPAAEAAGMQLMVMATVSTTANNHMALFFIVHPPKSVFVDCFLFRPTRAVPRTHLQSHRLSRAGFQ